jgi:histidinol-phosphate aminotransferase
VRPPYNVNVLSEAAAAFVLEHAAVLDAQADAICAERHKMTQSLASLPGVECFPSAANFLLLRINRPGLTGTEVFQRLQQQKVLVKNVGKMHSLLENCLRVTVSTPQENAAFLSALQSSLMS